MVNGQFFSTGQLNNVCRLNVNTNKYKIGFIVKITPDWCNSRSDEISKTKFRQYQQWKMKPLENDDTG